jgi:hypothetical protein
MNQSCVIVKWNSLSICKLTNIKPGISDGEIQIQGMSYEQNRKGLNALRSGMLLREAGQIEISFPYLVGKSNICWFIKVFILGFDIDLSKMEDRPITVNFLITGKPLLEPSIDMRRVPQQLRWLYRLRKH